MEKEMNAWIISIRLKTGCYRHLKVAKSLTLEELAGVILWSFDFDNDHAHAFFLDNHAWSDDDCYYADFVDEDEEFPHTNDVTADIFTLKQKFLFIFDFGVEWAFKCTILKESHLTDEDSCEVVKEVGQAPGQYDY